MKLTRNEKRILTAIADIATEGTVIMSIWAVLFQGVPMNVLGVLCGVLFAIGFWVHRIDVEED